MSERLISISALVAHIARTMRTPTVGEIVDDVLRSGVQVDPTRAAFHNARFARRVATEQVVEGARDGE